jgi:hypothetical protein
MIHRILPQARILPQNHRRPGTGERTRCDWGYWAIVAGHPGHFARRAIPFDGYCGVNRVWAHLADGDRWYEYPRYLFTNESSDILGLCGEVLDELGVAWRFSRRNAISVARREAVARLDEFVGPKY